MAEYWIFFYFMPVRNGIFASGPLSRPSAGSHVSSRLQTARGNLVSIQQVHTASLQESPKENAAGS